MKLRVTSWGLHLRSEPSRAAASRLVLPRGTRLTWDGTKVGVWRKVRVSGGTLNGWVGARHTEVEQAPWMGIAERELGVSELAGGVHNPRIIAYHSATTLKASTDEVPWCSSFVCWVMEMAGYRSTRSAAARSWLTWGAQLETPVSGCIVVLRRGSGGHVGFYADAAEPGRINLLGGNQGDRVCVAPYATSRVLGYRFPAVI